MKPHPFDDPIEARLRSDAMRVVAAAPAGMEGRIARAVAQSGRVKETQRRLGLGWFSALAGAAGVAAAVLLLLRADGKRSGGPSLLLGDEDRATSVSLAEAVQSMPAQIWNTFQPKAQAALSNDPLQADATALYSDARSALGFLAYNFLPGTTGATTARPPS